MDICCEELALAFPFIVCASKIRNNKTSVRRSTDVFLNEYLRFFWRLGNRCLELFFCIMDLKGTLLNDIVTDLAVKLVNNTCLKRGREGCYEPEKVLRFWCVWRVRVFPVICQQRMQFYV